MGPPLVLKVTRIQMDDTLHWILREKMVLNIKTTSLNVHKMHTQKLSLVKLYQSHILLSVQFSGVCAGWTQRGCEAHVERAGKARWGSCAVEPQLAGEAFTQQSPNRRRRRALRCSRPTTLSEVPCLSAWSLGLPRALACLWPQQRWTLTRISFLRLHQEQQDISHFEGLYFFTGERLPDLCPSAHEISARHSDYSFWSCGHGCLKSHFEWM